MRDGAPRLGRLILGAARDLRTLADRQLAPLGVTMQQAELLGAIYRSEDGTSPAALTALMLTDDAGVSRLVARLAAKELVRRRRSSVDRRALRLELTPAGRALAATIARRRLSADRYVFGALSEAERRALSAALARLSERARTMPAVTR